ncbi:hypothetical protein QVD17_14002 [Tagetes erecta]|uniref:Oleosin n=1 Tax=Tagetes erecta TaxID=13708 RepID=A0AAD8L0Q0_TARER|nr:hypothetical protein QVD17_14002 [Tagetes erecta]
METTTQYHSLISPAPDQHHLQRQQHHSYPQKQVSTKTLVIATIVGITVGGPLLALMGFIFLATMTLLVISSPILVIFSPVILGAGFVVAAALAGFGAAGLMAVAGLSALGWVYRAVKGGGELQQGLESVAGKLMESGENVKEGVKSMGKEWGSGQHAAGGFKHDHEKLHENYNANATTDRAAA